MNRNLNNETVISYIQGQLKKKGIIFETDLEKYNSLVLKHRMPNFKDIPIQDLTVQFLSLLDDSFDNTGKNFYLLRNRFLLYSCGNQKYFLDYYDHMVFLHYHKNCPEKEWKDQVDFWKWLFLKAREKQSEKIHGMFENKSAAIYNYYNSDLRGLITQAESIDKLITNSHVGREYSSIKELFVHRKSFKGLFEIRSFILGVFSFIEYVTNCLLPFLEAKNNKDWTVFLGKCREKNILIDKWTDLFTSEIVAYTSHVEGNKDIRQPAQVNIVNTFFETIKEVYPKYKELSDEYFSLKKAYRNVAAHGAIGYDFYDALTLNVVDLNSEKTEVPIFESLLNIDYHAFYRVNSFFQNYLAMIRALFPIAVLFLESALDIPTDLTEYIIVSEGKEERAKAYLEILNMNSIMCEIQYMLTNGMVIPSKKEFEEYITELLKISGFKLEDGKPIQPEYILPLIFTRILEKTDELGFEFIEADEEEDLEE